MTKVSLSTLLLFLWPFTPAAFPQSDSELLAEGRAAMSHNDCKSSPKCFRVRFAFQTRRRLV